MKTILALVLAAAAALAQDEAKKRGVERPVREAALRPVEPYDLSKTGIEWRRGLDAALNQGKPVLLFQLLGNFDDVYC